MFFEFIQEIIQRIYTIIEIQLLAGKTQFMERDNKSKALQKLQLSSTWILLGGLQNTIQKCRMSLKFYDSPKDQLSTGKSVVVLPSKSEVNKYMKSTENSQKWHRGRILIHVAQNYSASVYKIPFTYYHTKRYFNFYAN